MPNLSTNLIAFITITRYEIIRFSRIWVQTLLPPVITMTLYFIIFGNLIGPRVGKIESVNFIQFMMPGLVMMSIITNSYANVSSSFYTMRFQHCVEEILIAPVSNSLILSGFVLGGVLRGIMVGILVMLVSLFFTHVNIHNYGLTIFVTLLTSILFALAGFTNAILATKFDDIAIVPTFILTPLTYLGGVFYSIYQLPSLWQNISRLNPILYLINSFRDGIIGVSDINVTVAVSIAIFCIVLLFNLNLHLLNKGIGIRT